MVAIPLLLLGFDFITSPRVYHERRLREALAVNDLIEQRVIELGVVHAAGVFAAFENLAASKSLDYLEKRGTSALVISVFAKNGKLWEGQLARTVQQRLLGLSVETHQHVSDFFEALAQRDVGAVAHIPLNLPPAARAMFPIDHLIVVVFERGPSSNYSLEDVLPLVLSTARTADVEALVFPCIGYQWQAKNSLTFDQVLKPLFAAMDTSEGSMDIFISLYSLWPTFVLEEAVSSINHAWRGLAEAESWLAMLHRGKYRVLLVLLSVCLAASTRQVQGTWKSFLLISAAYLGLGAGFAELVEFLAPNYSALIGDTLLVAGWLVLALGFPVFLRWDVKEAFKKIRTAR